LRAAFVSNLTPLAKTIKGVKITDGDSKAEALRRLKALPASAKEKKAGRLAKLKAEQAHAIAMEE
jgi:hypothetical protein